MQLRINGKLISALPKGSDEKKMYDEVCNAIRDWSKSSDGLPQNVQFKPKPEYIETLRAFGGGSKVNTRKVLPKQRSYGSILTSNKQFYVYDKKEYAIELFDDVQFDPATKKDTYSPKKIQVIGKSSFDPDMDINKIFFMFAVLNSCTLLPEDHVLRKFQNARRSKKKERYLLVDKTAEQKVRAEQLSVESAVSNWIQNSGSDAKVRLAAIYFGIANAYTTQRKIGGIRLALYDKIITGKDVKAIATCLDISKSEVDISLDAYIKVAIERDCFRAGKTDGAEFIGWVSEDGMTLEKNIVKRGDKDIYSTLRAHLDGKKDEIELFKAEVTERTSFEYNKSGIKTI